MLLKSHYQLSHLIAHDASKDLHSLSSFNHLVKSLGYFVPYFFFGSITLFYTGHGRDGDGALILYGDTEPKHFNFEDFFRIWISYENSKIINLTLILDSCHSGFWVEKLRNHSELHQHKICIQAACAANEEAQTSVLRESWLKQQESDENEWEKIDSSITKAIQHPSAICTQDFETDFRFINLERLP